jgi:hypothetical protein
MIALLLCAAACAPAIATDAQWEDAAPRWVTAFARAPFLQQRTDFVRMSIDRKLDVAEWLPLLPPLHDARWRSWYADLGDEGLPPLFARMGEERDDRGRASLLELVAREAAVRPGWRPTKAERATLMRAVDSVCDPSLRMRGLEVLQALTR